jgi:hypothetical protein
VDVRNRNQTILIRFRIFAFFQPLRQPCPLTLAVNSDER